MSSPPPCTRLAQAVTGQSPIGLVEARALARLVPETFLAKASITAAWAGQQKLAAFLLAVLTVRDVELLSKVFVRAVLDAGTLRRCVAFLRSGSTGRRSFGTRPKKLVQGWLNACPVEVLRDEAFLFRPSLADIVRFTHPKPVDAAHQAVFGWMVGRPTNVEDLPEATRTASAHRREQLATRLPERRVVPPQRFRVRCISRVEGVEL